MLKIAIYGKGGIGKSTTTSNLAAALSRRYKVMQIGCDPKADSTKNLMGGEKISTVLGKIKEKGEDVDLSDLVHEGYNGVLCVESGGPTPGIGCAGLGIISALQKLEELGAFEKYDPDIVLYDVLGDVVCGGFAMPIRDGYAEHVFIVTSGEMMALFAADNISRAVDNFKERGYARVRGLILNERLVENETDLVTRFAREHDLPVISHIHRSKMVQAAEQEGKTVIEKFPQSSIAKDYEELADRIISLCHGDDTSIQKDPYTEELNYLLRR
ncbi:MAG TPA: nitrogenase iron protein [Clostridiales bacterium]|nr:nitrogenase iron protein [Clostridiales bacterium]